MSSDNFLNKQSESNKFPILLWVAILINAIIIALFVTFVFGLRKDAFEIDTTKLDKSMIIYKDGIQASVNLYEKRLKKIVESYPFSDFLQGTLLNGVDKTEQEKIVSIFRSGDYAFDSVALYMSDGQIVFSEPVNMKPANDYIRNMKNAAYDKSYDGIYFIIPIDNEQGINIGYIAASVDKKIFEVGAQKSNFILLDSGVVYYDANININNLPKDRLNSLLNNTEYSVIQNIDDTSLIFYSSYVQGVEGLNIAIVSFDVPFIQKSFKYIILGLLLASFIFLVIAAIIEYFKMRKERDEYIEDDSLVSEPNISESNNEDDNFDINEYNLASLDEDISYLDNIIEKDNGKDADDFEDMPSIEELDENNKYSNDDTFEDTFKNDDLSSSGVLVSRGETLEEEINKKEEEYFSSREAFNISFNKDFLSEDNEDSSDESIVLDEDSLNAIGEDEIVKKADENSVFETSDLIDSELYEPVEVPKIPDDYYKDAYNKVDVSKGWADILNAIKGVSFFEKTMDDMMNWIKEKSGIDIEHAVMVKKDELSGFYNITDTKNISRRTKELLYIDENEPLFTKILSYKKPLYVSDPFSSESLGAKFADEDKKNISRMIFIPIESTNSDIDSFFIGMSKN